MKRTIVLLLLALLLLGCARETQVWLPEEEVVELQGKDVIRIPMGTDTEPAATEAVTESAEETEPAETQPVKTEKATITKKATTTPKKNTSTATTTKKETITATGKPISTEPPVAEPPATEPPPTEPPTYDISDYRAGNLEYEMLARINEHRADAELELLWMDEWLCAIASCRSFEANQVWSHTRPDGRHFATVLGDYGYAASSVQELMVYDSGFADGTSIVDRWMESGTQRGLLLADFTTAGIGVYRVDGLTYVTCLLAK